MIKWVINHSKKFFKNKKEGVSRTRGGKLYAISFFVQNFMKEYKSFYKTVGGNEGDKCHYPTRLDTYGCGCQHDCSYCYAKSLLDFRGLWNPKEPSVADLTKIKKTIDKIEPGSVVRMGGMTDCFQPMEERLKVTEQTIGMLNDRGIQYLIVTKSDLVKDCLTLNPKLAHIQVTVTTTDDNKALSYEKATVPSKRIKCIEELQARGFDVALRLSPFIEGYVDYDVLNSVKCDKIIVEFLRVNTWIKKWFDLDFSEYTLKEGGYQHLPLEKKIEMLSHIKFKEISVCEDVDEHYEYWKTINHNPNDCCNLR